MDVYAASQQRSFISFRLGETSNGQPTQFTEERMETSQIYVEVADIEAMFMQVFVDPKD